jgi:hypothetical protein
MSTATRTATVTAASITAGRATHGLVVSDSGNQYRYMASPAKAPIMNTSPWAKLMSWMIP